MVLHCGNDPPNEAAAFKNEFVAIFNCGKLLILAICMFMNAIICQAIYASRAFHPNQALHLNHMSIIQSMRSFCFLLSVSFATISVSLPSSFYPSLVAGFFLLKKEKNKDSVRKVKNFIRYQVPVFYLSACVLILNALNSFKITSGFSPVAVNSFLSLCYEMSPLMSAYSLKLAFENEITIFKKKQAVGNVIQLKKAEKVLGKK